MRSLSLVLLILLTIVSISAAYTIIPGGTIFSDSTWNLAGSPYIVQGSVMIPAGVTLTVNPGVTVSFDGNYNITVNGSLTAAGTSGARVVFTTNTFDPAPVYWNGIANFGTLILSYTTISYGNIANVVCYSGTTTFSNTILNNAQDNGVILNGGSASFANTTITGVPVPLIQTAWGGTITFGSNNSFSGTEGSYYWLNAGPVAGAMTLQNPGIPYICMWGLSIPSGASLTVSAGNVLRLQTSTGVEVSGTLNATGNSVNRIRFTTNDPTPAAGQWNGVTVNSGSATFSYCDIEYAGQNGSSLLNANGGTTTVTASNLRYGSGYGLKLSGGNCAFSSSSISYCTWAIHQDTWSGNVTYPGPNTIALNANNGVYLTAPTTISASEAIANPGCPYYVVNSIDIPLGLTLTIAQSCVLKFQYGGYIHVSGTLSAVGGNGGTQKIQMTDIRDDVWGGDTNGDGVLTAPENGSWEGVTFYTGSSSSSRVDNCMIRYTGLYAGLSAGQLGGCINIFAASPKIKRCDLSTSYFSIRVEGVTSAEIDSNTFGIATSTPVALSMESFPSSQNNAFSASDNGFDAIGILPGTLTGNANLVQRNLTSIPNVTYVLLGSITIPSGRSLTIQPGVVVKFPGVFEIIVDGSLSANGTL
ncbi:MAG: hypothetical protein OEM52_12270, partial [bacterium]|nr:hypothetical protein [bacterium]